MAISFAQRVLVCPDILLQELDGEAVLLNLNSEKYFGLDNVGTRMWKALTAAESIQAAYEQLQSEYDVEAEPLRGDLQELVEKLVEHGLVQVDGQ